MPLSPGTVLQNRYRIAKLVGQGGFGAVYRGWDMALEQPVAVKENFDSGPESQRQFEREAKLLAGLRHPNLPRVGDHFSVPGKGQYLVMDFVEGKSLEELLAERGGPLGEAEALPWIRQVCDALTYLHTRTPPIIHRDIKPQNIIVTAEGRAMLVDFGISKVYDPTKGTTVGAKAVTPGYSPPEQYGRGRTDARSDVYSLGATLYTLLTGHVPPEAPDLSSGADVLTPPREVNPGVSEDTSRAIVAAMALSMSQRLRDVGAFGQMLAVRGASVAPQPVAPSAMPPDGGKRGTPVWGWLVGVAALVVLVAWAAVVLDGLNGDEEASLAVTATATAVAMTEKFATPTVTLSTTATATSAPTTRPTSTRHPTQTPIPTSTATPTISPAELTARYRQFSNPTGIAVDGAGNLYVTDTLNYRVQVFAADGTFLTQWGNKGSGEGQFDYPSSIVLDDEGNVYVADSGLVRIQKFTEDGTFLTQWGSAGSGAGQFESLTGIGVDGEGNVYTADAGNNRIQKFAADGTFLAGWGYEGTGEGQFDVPIDIDVGSIGDVYVADRDNNRIQKFSADGTFLTQWGSRGSGQGQFDWMQDITLDGAGNVYVLDQDNERIQKFTADGQFVTQWGNEDSGPFDYAQAVAVDEAGNFYVAEQGRIQKFATGGRLLAQWGNKGSEGGQFSRPTSITVDDNGNVYVWEQGNERIQKFTVNGSLLDIWDDASGAEGQFRYLNGIAADGDGNVYMANSDSNRIQKFAPDGTILDGRWGELQNPSYWSPAGISVDGDNNVYVWQITHEGSDHIQKFAPDGTFVTQWDVESAREVLMGGWSAGSQGIAVDETGAVYLLYVDSSRIQKFAADGTLLTQWGSSGSEPGQFTFPGGIAVDADGNVYITDSGRIQKFTPDGTFLTEWGEQGSGESQFSSPDGIVIDKDGNVYVADTGNHRIQKFTADGEFIEWWGRED